MKLKDTIRKHKYVHVDAVWQSSAVIRGNAKSGAWLPPEELLFRQMRIAIRSETFDFNQL